MHNHPQLTLAIIGVLTGTFYMIVPSTPEELSIYISHNPEIHKLISKWTQPKIKNRILDCCVEYGKVQSRYFYRSINTDRAKYYFSLDTNHDFKFYSEPRWERKCFSFSNPNVQSNKNYVVTIDNNLATQIANFFGGKNGDEYTTYVCLDAVTLDNHEGSGLGKFNTPIRWWDGGADSEVMTVSIGPNTNIEKLDNLPPDSNCYTGCSQCIFGCINKCTQCLNFISSIIIGDNVGIIDDFIHSDNNNLEVEYLVPPSPPRTSSVSAKLRPSLSTPGQLAGTLDRPLNWTIQNKFMNIHNYKLPLLHYNPSSVLNFNFTYDLVLNLNGDDFTLTMIYYNKQHTEILKKRISLNRPGGRPSVNCISLTQVMNMYKAIVECYDNFPKKQSVIISQGDYDTALNNVPDVKGDYWNIKNNINNILDFFYSIINGHQINDAGQKNYHTRMLLIFFFFNLKRSGDIGQIEAVKLLQQSYNSKEFVYLTLDSFAATIARDVYDVNVGLLSADKKSYTLCKRTAGGGAGGGEAGGEGATQEERGQDKQEEEEQEKEEQE
jgi:hypothetical protein